MKNLGSFRREILPGAQNDKNSLLMAHGYKNNLGFPAHLNPDSHHGLRRATIFAAIKVTF